MKQGVKVGDKIVSNKNVKGCVFCQNPDLSAVVDPILFTASIPINELNFNPRTREGCDSFVSTYITHSLYFNPRTREGCDSFMFVNGLCLTDFNPRTREGCDMIMMQRKWMN